VLEELAAPWLPELEVRARSRRSDVRARSVQTLATLGMPLYARTVVAALDDAEPHVAMTAARALAHREHAAFASEILSRIERFHHWHIRFLASMLANIGVAGAPALRATLMDEALTPQSRAVAAHALALLKDLGSGEIAAGVIDTANDTELLSAALALLAEVGHGAHLPNIIGVLRRSVDEPVRAHALQTIGSLGSARDVPLLLDFLHDESPWVSLRAAYALADVGALDELRRRVNLPDRSGELAREVLSMVA
jgi:HEAT repeat protein